MSQAEDTRSSRLPTTQASHDAEAFDAYRAGLDEAADKPVPRLNLALLVLTIVSLGGAIAFSFAPWIEYVREDGSVGHANGVRGDAFVLIIASIVAIVMLVVASWQKPGHGDFQALVGFGASVVGAIAVVYTLMDPGFIPIDEPETPVSHARDWGLYLTSLCAVLGTVGAYRLWKTADHF